MAYNIKFTPVIDAPKNTLVTSEEITLQGIVGSILVSVTGTDAQLIVDGTPESGSVPMSSGQTLQIGVRSSVLDANVSHAIVDFGGEYEAAFSVMTAAPSNPVVFTDQQGNSVVEFDPAYAGGTQAEQNNRLFSIDANGTATNVALVPDTTPDPSVLGDDAEYLYVADFHNNFIHRLNTSMAVVHSIACTRPYAVGYTPTEIQAETYEVDILASDPINNKVRIFRRSNDYSMNQTVTVGAEPHDVIGLSSAGDSTKIGFAVACRGKDAVEVWHRPAVGGPYSKTVEFSLPADSNPTGLVTDGTAFYVTLPGTGQVAKLVEGQANQYVTVGTDPNGIVIDGQTLYVTCPSDTSITPIATSTFVPSTAFYTQDAYAPYTMSVMGTTLHVACIDSGKLERFDIAGTPARIDTVNIGKHAIGAYTYNDSVRVLCMYENAGDRSGQPGFVPDGFDSGFVNPVGIPPDSPVVSSPVTVSGLDDYTIIHVPDIWNASIFVDGVDRGLDATVYNGDTFAVHAIMSSDPSDVINIPVTTVSSGFNWVITGTMPDPEPVSGYIAGG